MHREDLQTTPPTTIIKRVKVSMTYVTRWCHTGNFDKTPKLNRFALQYSQNGLHTTGVPV